MSLWNDFWKAEEGAVVSAELVAVGTVAVVGMTAGLSTLSKSVDGELKELAYSIRSLNQSYAYAGHTGCQAWTAGSSYTQPDVNQSIEILGDEVQTGTKLPSPPKVIERKVDEPQQPTERKKEDKRRKKQERQDDEQAAGPSVTPATEQVQPELEAADDVSQSETVIQPNTDA